MYSALPPVPCPLPFYSRSRFSISKVATLTTSAAPFRPRVRHNLDGFFMDALDFLVNALDHFAKLDGMGRLAASAPTAQACSKEPLYYP